MKVPITRLPTLMTNWLKPNLLNFVQNRQGLVWALSLLVGVGAAILAVLLRETIELMQYFWIGFDGQHLYTVVKSIAWYHVAWGPIAGGAIVGILLNRISTRRTGGIADVIEARALTGRQLPTRDGLWSALIAAISMGFGASSGREGPAVHLGATLATLLTKKFHLPQWSRRTLLGAGAASAVAASFNAPIAGVLFAHEVILGHYSMRSLVPIVLSSTAGAVVGRAWHGNDAAFSIPYHQITSYWEFPAFAILGVVAAIVGILFQFSLFSAEYIARNIEMPLWLRPILGGVALATIGVFYPHILGVGYDITNLALQSNLPLMLMLTLIVLKTIATSITLASRFGGGVFAPALFLGALTGASFGAIAAYILPDLASSQSLYAILGMGAVAGAVLGAPISTAMIVFELTGGYALSIALLLTVAVAQGVTQAIHGHSWFQWQLEMRGLFVQDGPHRAVVANIKVMDFMDLPGENDNLILDKELDEPTLKPTDTLELALRHFDGGGHDRLYVVDPADSTKIIAYANRVRALSYFNRALVAASEEEHR